MIVMQTENREAAILNGVKKWASFYRANPHRFAKDYMGIDLKVFQKILLYMMNICYYFCYIAARGHKRILKDSHFPFLLTQEE